MSFAITHLAGFGAYTASSGGEVLVDRTTGTNIGNTTFSGGLAAAFDGTTSQASAACAAGVNSPDDYVGKTFGAGKRASRVVVHGSNDQGFANGANPSTTLTLYGKNGAAPANATDGTSLGSTTFTDTTNESSGRTITSTDTTTSYLHWWVKVDVAGNSSAIAELVMYEMT